MKLELNGFETRYRKTMGNLGLTMCLFLVLFYGSSLILGSVSIFFLFFPISEIWYNTVSDLLYGAFYLLAFMLPVLLFKKKMQSAGIRYRSMYAQPKISPYLPMMLFAVIFLIRTASYLNAGWSSIFDDSQSMDSWYDSEMQPYQIIIEFIITCVVPGFCEEFLFRGAILTNCLPFGRTKAILISSILFAIMHANPAQLFYTFVAGVLFGIIYEKTGSIWNCVILHIFNNFFSLIDDVLFANFYEYSMLISTVIEGVISILGILSIVFLCVRFFSKKQDLSDGFYQKELPASDSYAVCPIAASRACSLFFAPTMLAFLVASILTIII